MQQTFVCRSYRAGDSDALVFRKCGVGCEQNWSGIL